MPLWEIIPSSNSYWPKLTCNCHVPRQSLPNDISLENCSSWKSLHRTHQLDSETSRKWSHPWRFQRIQLNDWWWRDDHSDRLPSNGIYWPLTSNRIFQLRHQLHLNILWEEIWIDSWSCSKTWKWHWVNSWLRQRNESKWVHVRELKELSRAGCNSTSKFGLTLRRRRRRWRSQMRRWRRRKWWWKSG